MKVSPRQLFLKTSARYISSSCRTFFYQNKSIQMRINLKFIIASEAKKGEKNWLKSVD